VASRFVVVAEVRRQRSLEMAGVQNDVVVEAVPSDRAYEPLGVWILPGTLRRSQNLLHAQRLDSQSNLSTVPAVAIADEILSSLSVCERLYDLLCRPSPGRMFGDIKVQHLATIVFQDDKYEQNPHGDRRHSKEIGRYHLADMVMQESPPRLVRRPTKPAQDTRHGAFGDGDAEHLQFAMNPGCAPQRIGGGHLLDNRRTSLTVLGRPRRRRCGLESLAQNLRKPFALPADDRVCLDVNQGISPVGPQAAEKDPK
jgi:hypothetical protein